MMADDAWVEDSVDWVCPECGCLNRTPADDMQCAKLACASAYDSSNFDWETSDELVMQIIDDMLDDLTV